LWGVPLCVRYEVPNAGSKVQCELVDQAEAKIELKGASPVSYTHLDVYKRQSLSSAIVVGAARLISSRPSFEWTTMT
ncbi:hypothetical protein AB723_19335, partial [Acinetobacter baumannii]